MGGSGNGGVSTILQEKSNGTATPSAHSTSDTLHQVVPPPHHVLDPRDTSKHTFFARAFRSASAEAFDDANRPGQQGQGQGKEYLGLPFRLTVYTAQEHTNRNVPYLRHSWNRIDFIAIIAFWITFSLAQSGVERSERKHIAIFRALSVLRTSRLLAITSGTTVCTFFLPLAHPRTSISSLPPS